MASQFDSRMPEFDWYDRRLARERARDGLCGHLPPRRRQANHPLSRVGTAHTDGDTGRWQHVPSHSHAPSSELATPVTPTAPTISTALTAPAASPNPTPASDKVNVNITSSLARDLSSLSVESSTRPKPQQSSESGSVHISFRSIGLYLPRAVLSLLLISTIYYSAMRQYRLRPQQDTQGADIMRDWENILLVGEDIRHSVSSLPHPVPVLPGWSDADSMQLVLEDQLDHTLTTVDRVNRQLISDTIPELVRSHCLRKCRDFLQALSDLDKQTDKIITCLQNLTIATGVILSRGEAIDSQLEDDLILANIKHTENINDESSTLQDEALQEVFLIRANTSGWRASVANYTKVITKIERNTNIHVRRLQEWQPLFRYSIDLLRNQTSVTDTDMIDCRVPSTSVLNSIFVGADGLKDFWPSLQA